VLDSIADDEDFMDSTTTAVLVYFQATAGYTYEAALVADDSDLSTGVTWVKVITYSSDMAKLGPLISVCFRQRARLCR